MRRLIDQALEVRPALIGTLGTGTTAVLEGINAVIGILVGLATLVYLEPVPRTDSFKQRLAGS